MNIMRWNHGIIVILLFTVFACSKANDSRPPNILLIMADDMGTDVFDAYGGTSYDTPNIDGLSESGLTFNHCYSAPACSPSRVKLMTGRYGFRTGQTWGSIPADEITFGHILKKAGYKTAISGKWQMELLKNNPNHIQEMGFDESCVFGWHEGPRYYEPMIYQNGEIREGVEDKYGPDVYTDFLIDFIKRNKDQPFLAYYSMALAHDISDDLTSPPPVGKINRYETFKENVEYADVMVGKVLAAIDELKLNESTLILFIADNGTPYRYVSSFENGKYIKEPVFSKVGDTLLQGGKTHLTNGGTHVPMFVKWKGKTPIGERNDDLVDFSDFISTFAELTGADLPTDRAIDSKSFAPQLSGEKGNPREWVYQLFKDRDWIRTKDWKLYGENTLYNMKEDPYEQREIIAEKETEESKRMRGLLTQKLTNLKQ